jgi:predicted O-methyltransferase YrrM
MRFDLHRRWWLVGGPLNDQRLRRVPEDPFALKRLSKVHPCRIAFTLRSRVVDKVCQVLYERYLLPQKHVDVLPLIPEADFEDTAVTPVQAQYLLAALAASEGQRGTCVVEVGCWAGVTTKLLAQSTARRLYAVDPYLGATSRVLERFRIRTRDLEKVIHLRTTSGQAALNWKFEPVSMIFIDAAHDYYNVRFDIEAWDRILVPGGFLAVHDTDQRCFAGTRRAVFEVAHYYTLFAHPDNLTILGKLHFSNGLLSR